MSLDYQLFNILGYTCYSIYTGSLLFNNSIKKEYNKNFGTNLVSVNDFFFALHGLVLTLITLFQCSIYDRGGQQFARPTVALVACAASISVLYALLIPVFSKNGNGLQLSSDLSLMSWLCWIYWLSLVKLGVTLCKYVPQAVMNCKSRSTVGWSIHNVLLDFTGGFLSVAQLMLDGATLGWSGLIGDPIKFALGFVSVVFDAVFMFQHYVLFTDRTDKAIGGRAGDERLSRAEPTVNLLTGEEYYDLVDGKYSPSGDHA
jgi:cystinosin